jgi:ABC-type transport system involved in multi-copper enzyme maturation permease subunit
MIFATIFIPARLLASQMDNNTLDVMLSYPVPRWRYALEKFSVFLSYNVLYPVLLLSTTYVVNIIMINIDYITPEEAVDLVVVGYATIGSWSLFFALGALSFLCGTIFLESNKAMAFSALVILGQYMMERFGGIVASINFLQDFSLFHYLTPAAINRTGTFPIGDLIIVLSIGLIATFGGLYIFQRRELT